MGRGEISVSSLYHVQEAKLHPSNMKLTLQLIYLPISKQVMTPYFKHHPRHRRLSYLSLNTGKKPTSQLLKTQQTSWPQQACCKDITENQQIYQLLMPAMSSAEPMQPEEGDLD